MNENRIPASVIIVNYKTPELTIKALRALYNSSALPKQVILVDNKSNDGIEDLVRNEFPEVEVMMNHENVGFAKANNMAIRDLVNQPFIWLLNSDTETGRHSLEQLYKYMEIHREIGVLGPQLVYPNGALQSVGGYFPDFTNVLGYLLPFGFFLPQKIKRKSRRIALYPQLIPESGLLLDYVTGAACMLRKEALDQVGLLGEEFFMYFEEVALCWRMKQAGWKVKVIPTEPVMHVYGGSFQTKRDPKRLKLFLSSLKLFVKRNYSGFKKYAILAEVWLFGNISVYLKQLRG